MRRMLQAVCALVTTAASAAGQAPPGQKPAGSAPVDEKALCIQAFDRAQVERAASRYLASQKQLIQCARPICGNALMAECTQMYTEIDRAIPSVVLSAHDEAANVDLTGVEVTLDGRTFATVLDGKPIPIDPGDYEFVFRAPGKPEQRRTIVIGTGDKYRQVQVIFPAPKPAPESAVVAAPASDGVDEGAGGLGRVPAMSFVLGGVGLAGLGTFATLRLIGNDDFDSMKQDCAPTCTESDVSGLRKKFVFSNVALGVGIGATAGALLWWVIAPAASEDPPVAIGPSPTGQGVLATANGRF